MVKSPVSEGNFREGTELMLWNPALDRTRLRRQAIKTSTLPVSALTAAVGVGAIVVGITSKAADFAGSWVVLGIVAVVAAIAYGCFNYWCFGEYHAHRSDRPCRLDRTPGEFFHRSHDFVAMPAPVAFATNSIIRAVNHLHTGETATWLDPRHLRSIHQVAWETLRRLDQTRAARQVVDEAVDRPELADAMRTTRAELAEVDRGVLQVLDYLLQAVTLTEAWNRKLREQTAQVRKRADHPAGPLVPIARTVGAAAAIPEGIFVHITAARDFLDAGPFEWEQPTATSRPQSDRGERRPWLAVVPTVWNSGRAAAFREFTRAAWKRADQWVTRSVAVLNSTNRTDRTVVGHSSRGPVTVPSTEGTSHGV